jgi:hypothetical protein
VFGGIPSVVLYCVQLGTNAYYVKSRGFSDRR